MPSNSQSNVLPTPPPASRPSVGVEAWLSRGGTVAKRLAFEALESFGLNSAFRWRNRGKIKVLVLHSIRDDGVFDNALPVREFERLLDYLQQHHSVVGMTADGNWTGLRTDRVNVLLTFDDGFVDNLERVAPILRQRGLSGIFFLISECVELQKAPSFLRERKLAPGADVSTLGAADTRRLASLGMTVGSHSITHCDFRTLPPREVLGEASASKAYLSSATGQAVECFAFPWGHYLPWQLRAVRAHYHRVFTVEHGFNRPEDTVLHRNDVATAEHGFAAASGALDAARRLVFGRRTRATSM